jgi:NodT family efflux transporter outer membrane factor (OMF) lipoprotein
LGRQIFDHTVRLFLDLLEELPHSTIHLTVLYGLNSIKWPDMPILRRLSVLVLTAGFLALAGCAAIPKLDSAASPKSAGDYATSVSFAAPPAAWPEDGWWRAYGDPQLTTLIEAAIADSPTMAQAKARVLKAEAQEGESRSATLPTLEADGSFSEVKETLNQGFPAQFAQYLPRGYNSSGYLALKFGYEFDFWGKNRAAVAAATSEVQAAQADAAESRLALSTGIALAYADLARLFAEHDVAERSSKVKEETAGLVLRRVDNGLDTRAELKEAEAGAPAARAQMAAVDEETEQTRNRIAALMGAGPDRGMKIERPAISQLKAFGMPARLEAELLGRRPDVVAARWRAEAAAKRIGVARAQFYPNINLAAYIGQQALFANLLFRNSSQIGGVGPAVTLPIFEGGRLRAQYRGAHADYDDAVASYDATLIQALRELADTAASERALRVRLQESGTALAADEEAFRLTRLRYEGGLANYQSVLLAEDAVLQARLIVADLAARAFTLDVQLVQALGGGYAQS